jgi:hypothetical protein
VSVVGLVAILVGVAALVAIVMSFFVRRHAESSLPAGDWQCGATFPLSALAGAFAPHRLGGRKWIRCPQCGRFFWAAPLPRV